MIDGNTNSDRRMQDSWSVEIEYLVARFGDTKRFEWCEWRLHGKRRSESHINRWLNLRDFCVILFEKGVRAQYLKVTLAGG